MQRAAPSAGQPDRRPDTDDAFAAAVLDGLSRSRKTLPSRFFYDAAGSELFEAITRLPEYYLTRAETAILSAHAADMIDALPAGGVLVEFGSGFSLKTELLLANAPPGLTYVPIDVSETALAGARSRLADLFPALDVRPMVADFAKPLRFARDLAHRRKLGFFPGSTIGNLVPPDAVTLLRSFLVGLSPGGRLIIGVDLKKEPRKLARAYNDAAGLTAAFNLNLLTRINRELGGNFDLSAFRHEAIYDAHKGRIEMHLVSTTAQNVRIAGRQLHFRAGESIHTENSYKYEVGEFQDVARAAGWRPARFWTDAGRQFSVIELVSGAAPADGD